MWGSAATRTCCWWRRQGRGSGSGARGAGSTSSWRRAACTSPAGVDLSSAMDVARDGSSYMTAVREHDVSLALNSTMNAASNGSIYVGRGFWGMKRVQMLPILV
ncbi:hypothetical protein PR202_ga21145 [Eleusine coracana subsp. coracana]|uniref:Uncharacterized protein n=1 Tax=Eleusine coracana subsp. coracana TaxID=191504 RepID=A0AAV5CYD5_ELECO|nr:hypothetical protein PR202_ga21145 [Eleusine coracana subsp. coracana]